MMQARVYPASTVDGNQGVAGVSLVGEAEIPCRSLYRAKAYEQMKKPRLEIYPLQEMAHLRKHHAAIRWVQRWEPGYYDCDQ